MTLVEQAKDFLRNLNFSVDEKDRNLLLAEQPGLGSEKERLCLWILTKEGRQGRQMLSLEEEYLARFRGIADKYLGARLYLLVDTLEGLSAQFRAQAKREYGVSIQVPVWFFDLPFKYEIAPTAASAIKELVDEARSYEARRVPQPYEREDGQGQGADLVSELMQQVDEAQGSLEPRIWFVVAPAGQGKSIFFSSLFSRLYRRFDERRRRQILCPRPLPFLPAHIREAAGQNVGGLVDAFLRTDVAMPRGTRQLFDWMVDNRFGLWMLDGLDEVIARDTEFFPYLEDRITAPGAHPAVVICVRDSLFQTSDELSEFLDYYSSVVRVLRLKPWDRGTLRAFAWVGLEGRAPRAPDGDSEKVRQFLQWIDRHPALKKLSSIAFYADLCLKVFKESGAADLTDELALVDLAIEEMCAREYGKGLLDRTILPLAALREWLEEVAVVGYEAGGVSVTDLRDLADALPALVTREIREDEGQALIDQILMAPFLTRSGTSGRIELTHEILGEYLAGRRFAREFSSGSPTFVKRLSKRAWPPDSILFRVLSQAVEGNLDRLASLAISEALTPDGLRNLVQVVVMSEGGDSVLRDSQVRLDGARLTGVRFLNQNFSEVSFRGCDLTNCDFSGSALHGTHFEGAVLKNTHFTHLPVRGLEGAHFGDAEHFESVFVGESRRIDDHRLFQDWAAKETGSERGIAMLSTGGGPCPTSLQMLHLFRKFVHIDGQPRRDALNVRGTIRGKQVTGAPEPGDCLSAALEFGYLEKGQFDLIRRTTGSRYGEMVTFVKSLKLASELRSLLDSLCRIQGCQHTVTN